MSDRLISFELYMTSDPKQSFSAQLALSIGDSGLNTVVLKLSSFKLAAASQGDECKALILIDLKVSVIRIEPDMRIFNSQFVEHANFSRFLNNANLNVGYANQLNNGRIRSECLLPAVGVEQFFAGSENPPIVKFRSSVARSWSMSAEKLGSVVLPDLMLSRTIRAFQHNPPTRLGSKIEIGVLLNSERQNSNRKEELHVT